MNAAISGPFKKCRQLDRCCLLAQSTQAGSCLCHCGGYRRRGNAEESGPPVLDNAAAPATVSRSGFSLRPLNAGSGRRESRGCSHARICQPGDLPARTDRTAGVCCGRMLSLVRPSVRAEPCHAHILPHDRQGRRTDGRRLTSRADSAVCLFNLPGWYAFAGRAACGGRSATGRPAECRGNAS